MIKELLSWLAVGAAGLSALLAITGSAHATFLTCREWDALDRNERETYIGSWLTLRFCEQSSVHALGGSGRRRDVAKGLDELWLQLTAHVTEHRVGLLSRHGCSVRS